MAASRLIGEAGGERAEVLAREALLGAMPAASTASAPSTLAIAHNELVIIRALPPSGEALAPAAAVDGAAAVADSACPCCNTAVFALLVSTVL